MLMFLCFLGRLGPRAQEGVTRIYKSSYRRTGVFQISPPNVTTNITWGGWYACRHTSRAKTDKAGAIGIPTLHVT